MQTVNAALQAELDKGQVDPIVLVDLYELYASNYTPGVNGFVSADAIEKFAAQEITWNGIAYRREVIDRADAAKNMGEKTNSVSLTFSNISRYMATLAQSQEMEGLFLVIRTVNPSVTTDSLVLFVGRCDKPSDIDKQRFTLSVRQDFGNINQSLPPRRFENSDPDGRLPSDPLYRGIDLIGIGGSLAFPQVVPSTSFFGRLFGRRDTVIRHEQWSSLNSTPFGQVIPEHFGRVQVQLIPIAWADKGSHVGYLMVAGNGRLDSITNLKSRTAGMSNPICSFANPPASAVIHLGDPGGTGTNNGNTCQADLAGGRFFSHLAYIEGASAGVDSNGNIVALGLDVADSIPEITALIRGKRIPLRNSSGVYGAVGWTDNPVDIARFILTDPDFIGINAAFMEDSILHLTAQHCDEPILDNSGDQIIVVPGPDIAVAGTDFIRYRATGIYNPRYILFNHLGDPSIIPEFVGGPYIGRNISDPPVDPSNPADPTYLAQKPLRKRYTANFPISEEVRAVDLLYKTLFPAAKLIMRVNKNGKYEILSEKPSDATRLRTATTVGATSIPVMDVTPWKTGPEILKGWVHLGFGLTTSENRKPSAAVYSTSGNSVTLAVSKTGAVTITASGATLTGGSTTVQASGTITIGGTPALGDTVTVTIDGIAVQYIVEAGETTGTVAALLHYRINANQRLNKYIRASWASASPTVITLTCLHGALTVPALLKAHATAIADPTTAPTVAAAAGGSLPAGTYLVAYTDTVSLGSTPLTANASVVVTVNQKINVSALPALVGTGRDFYMSEKAGSTNLRYVASRTDAANFSISSVPANGAALPPSHNTTAEELIRIAMPFATNSQDVFPVWPASTLVILNDIYLPTTANGHKYQVTTGGTTGATEPTWPTSAGGTVASGSAVFTEIGSTVLQQSGLTRANVKKDTLKWPLGSRQASTNVVEGNYRDAKTDFALTPFRVRDDAHYAQVKKWFPLKIDLSAVDNFNQMSRLANFNLSKNREGDWFVSLGTGPAALVLEEGDLISVSDDSGGLINVICRIEDLRIHENHDVTIAQARRYSTLMFSDDVGSHRIPLPSTLKFSATKNTLSQFIDNYAIRDVDALSPGFYWVPSHDLDVDGDWRGAGLYADYGDGYVLIAESDVPGSIGTATTTLGSVADPSVFDRTNSITFTLDYVDATTFATVTEAELLSNSRRNLFLVDDEYIQAATVVANGNRSFTLSTLLRGRFGTDTPDHLSHGAAERVIYLNGAEQFVGIDPVRLNGAFNYKSVTTNQDIADATAVSFAWTGGNLRPLAPVNLTGTRDAAGNLLIQWTRRSRLSPGLFPDSDVPLGEEEEIYDVEIMSGAVVKRLINVRRVGAAPAVLAGIVQSGVISGNNFGPGSGDFAYASIVQNLGPEAFVEATLTFSTASSRVDLYFVEQAYIDWVASGFMGTLGTNPWSNVSFRNLGGLNKFNVTDTAPPGTPYNSPDLGAVTTARIRATLSDTGIRYYWDYMGETSVPFYVSRAIPTFPAFCLIELVGTGAAKDIHVGSTFNPSTVYTVAQQTSDFGAVQNPVTVRVSQVSAIVGRGPFVEGSM